MVNVVKDIKSEKFGFLKRFLPLNILYSFLKRTDKMKDMGIQIGPWDPLKLTFNLIGNLMKNGYIKYDDAVEILSGTLPPTMTEEQKKEIIDKMIIKK